MKGVSANITRGLPTGARLIVADNTGAKEVEIVAILKSHNVHRRYPKAGIGDIIVGSVKKGTPEQRKQLVNAVIVRQKMPYKRADGTRIAFEDNACVITTPTGETKGSEIKGPVAREAADRWPRVSAIATMIV